MKSTSDSSLDIFALVLVLIAAFLFVRFVIKMAKFKQQKETSANQFQHIPLTSNNSIKTYSSVSGSFKCPNCGAFTKGQHISSFICEYCGSPIPDLQQLIMNANFAKEQELRREKEHQYEYEKHNMDIETMNNQIRWQKVKNIRPTTEMVKWIIAGIIVLIMTILIIIGLPKK